MKTNTPRSSGPGKRLQNWYHEYWAQTWYKNTFLVSHPKQIARTKGKEREWNNLFDAGCNFACLAMIVGIDPARLASLLSAENYFQSDSDLPAKRIGGKHGGLVWDQNAPNAEMTSIALRQVWHPKLGRRVSIAIGFVQCHATRSLADGERLVAEMHRRGRHVVCGPEAHSHLVAGTAGSDFFVWDPDDTEKSVEENLGGRVTLDRLFAENPTEPIEFWEYQVDVF